MLLKEFDSMSDAFDYCRELNKPVTVRVCGTVYRLFPSGRAERVNKK